MDLQTEKLRLIEWLARLQDTEVVQLLLELKKSSESAAYEASLKPMTVEELINRAKESNRAIKEGNYSSIEDALSDLEG